MSTVEPVGEPVDDPDERVKRSGHVSDVLEEVGAPIEGPERGPTLPVGVAAPRLARHVITLADGHRVGVAVSGRGIPLVAVHGFSVEGMLYAQTLSRLVSMGFKVVTIDTAGHGGTAGLPRGAGTLSSYAELLGRVLDELGIRRAVFAGHSMGGRLVAELVATEPRRGIAVVLVDAIVGEPWDRMVYAFRMAPPLLAGIGAALVLDTASTAPFLRNPRQAGKLGKLLLPSIVEDVRRPWRLLGPGISILRSRGSRWLLQRLARAGIPVFVLHGDRDLGVPLSTGRSAAKLAGGELVVIKGGSHSWLLKDPETLPAIVAELREGRLGEACATTLTAEGLDPDTATLDEIEAALYAPGAKVLDLTPEVEFEPTGHNRHLPRYRWTVERFGA
jgi:pimeloyl-ACP methyl ester carboxylesterase